MLGVSEQLSQLALSSPSKPAFRHAASTATASAGAGGQGVVVLNPYSPTPTPAELAALDTSLSSAVAALVHHLTQPLSAHYAHQLILSLRSILTAALSELYAPTWRPLEPSYGTGSRSLICTRTLGLPKSLRAAAAQAGISGAQWRAALRGKAREDAPPEDRERDEWEAWCDPGSVCWRYGNWKYFDAEFDPIRPLPETTMTIWQAGPAGTSFGESSSAGGAALTPARPSAAITIRAPAPVVSFIPATPAHTAGVPTVPAPLPVNDNGRPVSPALMPAASIGARPAHSRSSSTAYSRSPSPISEGDENSSSSPIAKRDHARASTYPARSGHRQSSGSSSSISSTISDSNSGHTQLLTPASRPGSADPFTTAANMRVAADDDKTPTNGTGVHSRGRDPSPVSVRQNTPIAPGVIPSAKPTPAVTPYDGGNVTVLGGGVKLGGGGPSASRSGSVISSHRHPMSIDRSRSPSVSLASRALNSALTPGELTPQHTGSSSTGRKTRTRRRIMPTYLGYVGQPGVGGPVGHAFQPMMKGLSPISPIAGQPGQQVSPGQMWQGGVGVGVGIGMPPIRQQIPMRIPS